MTLTASVVIIASYLIGAIPFGLVFSRNSGIDIRTAGSKNIGATNVTRLLGKKMGILTLLADIAKGYLPLLLAGVALRNSPQYSLFMALCGAAVVLGHMFPIYLGFKGGKGVATAVGVFLYLSPPALACSIIVFAAAVFWSGFVSAGSLSASALIGLWIWLFNGPTWKIGLGCFIALLIWLKHYQNIGRLLRGEEKSWKKKADK